jgi:hypothetical protein
MKTTKLSKAVREVAESMSTTPEAVCVMLASGELVKCAECGYPTAPADLREARCEGCDEDYNCPTYSEPYCTLGE